MPRRRRAGYANPGPDLRGSAFIAGSNDADRLRRIMLLQPVEVPAATAR